MVRWREREILRGLILSVAGLKTDGLSVLSCEETHHDDSGYGGNRIMARL